MASATQPGAAPAATVQAEGGGYQNSPGSRDRASGNEITNETPTTSRHAVSATGIDTCACIGGPASGDGARSFQTRVSGGVTSHRMAQPAAQIVTACNSRT